MNEVGKEEVSAGVGGSFFLSETKGGGSIAFSFPFDETEGGESIDFSFPFTETVRCGASILARFGIK